MTNHPNRSRTEMINTAIDTTIAELIASGRIKFGSATHVEWGTNDLAQGGWVNIDVPVRLDGVPLGTALVGAWVLADEVGRTGYTIDDYAYSDCQWTGAKLETLAPDDDNAEAELLRAAEASHSVDYDDYFRDALRARLSAGHDDTYRLLAAVRALAHDPR